MNRSALRLTEALTKPPASVQGLLQRKCACGNHTLAGGDCAECGLKKNSLQRETAKPRAKGDGNFLPGITAMQRRLTIGAENDPLEQEADRVAEQVLAAPAHPAVSGSTPRIQRYTGQLSGEASMAPASVARVLAGSGRPLDRALQQDLGQRFGHDFSQVRVHSGAAAEQSAREMHANAYTVGHNIVFGAGQFAPGSPAGRRLLAHELTHVVQQSVNEKNATTSSHSPSSHYAQNVQREVAGAGKAAPMEAVAGTLWATDAAGKTLPPSLDDISQGAVADCFLFAAMAAIVNTNPQHIVDMIRDNGNGTYTVTFKGIGFFSSAKQTVSANFAVGRHGNVTARKALWPIIIEKAYAQEKGGLDKLGQGGNAGDALDDMLNDGPSRFDPREKTSDYIMGKLAKAKEKKWPMTILSPKKDDATKEKKAMADGTPGLHFWHTYAIIDVDPRKDRIKLFNPWGHDHPNGDGWIDVAQVRKFFIEIDIND
jgi:hypothetical protein